MDWEQNSDTSSEVFEIVPDRISGFILEGGGIGLYTLLISSSGSGSSPRPALAWFS